jgi:hypothetical protein
MSAFREMAGNDRRFAGAGERVQRRRPHFRAMRHGDPLTGKAIPCRNPGIRADAPARVARVRGLPRAQAEPSTRAVECPLEVGGNERFSGAAKSTAPPRCLTWRLVRGGEQDSYPLSHAHAPRLRGA